MNAFKALTACLLAPVLGFAQTPRSSAASEPFVCHYYGQKTYAKGPCDVHPFASNQHAEAVVDRILKPVGLARNFAVVECPNTQNCFATWQNGVRYIVYDNSFMKLVEDRTNTDWASVSIMAHEIAHHLQGHTGDGTGSRPHKELQADEWSGFVLHQLGATLDEAQIAIRVLQSEAGDYTHPPRSQRLQAIEKGWRNAAALYPGVGKPAPSLAARTPTEAPRTLTPAPARTETPKPSVGCVAGNCADGEGVYINRKNGERYAGTWENNRPHGFGWQYYASGKKKYEGEFQDGQFEGRGTHWLPNGNVYTGEFRAGQYHGRGTLYYANGDRYIGAFWQGKRQGAGKYVYASGQQEAIHYWQDARQETRTE
jgi:hypothetical protein